MRPKAAANAHPSARQNFQELNRLRNPRSAGSETLEESHGTPAFCDISDMKSCYCSLFLITGRQGILGTGCYGSVLPDRRRPGVGRSSTVHDCRRITTSASKPYP
ncbi:hypothetical protein BCAR13_60119 [Paraburkholderia caribensis]|nr:hypothetical protein BCAR13_60119 [Paraburkholderia caribensis]